MSCCTVPMSSISSIAEPCLQSERLFIMLNSRIINCVSLYDLQTSGTSIFSSHKVTVIVPEESAATTSCLILSLSSVTRSPFDNTFTITVTFEYSAIVWMFASGTGAGGVSMSFDKSKVLV